jgi:hypothetical protein
VQLSGLADSVFEPTPFLDLFLRGRHLKYLRHLAELALSTVVDEFAESECTFKAMEKIAPSCTSNRRGIVEFAHGPRDEPVIPNTRRKDSQAGQKLIGNFLRVVLESERIARARRLPTWFEPTGKEWSIVAISARLPANRGQLTATALAEMLV